MNLAHIHILLNHFPTIGTIVTVGIFILGLIMKSDDLKRVSLVLFVGLGLVTIATYITGAAAEEQIIKLTGVSKDGIEAHKNAALLAFAFMQITAMAAWIGLWQIRRIKHASSATMTVVAIFAVISLGLMAQAANVGGEIRHPEILASPSDASNPASSLIDATAIGKFVVGAPWMWPSCETLHFIGLSLLIGVVLLVDMRMLGFMKSIPFSAIHRLMPWAILGFGINVLTGMAFFVGAPEQYTQNIAFQWKIALVLIAGLNALYFTVLDEAWEIKAGDDAPLTAKVMALAAISLWVGVMYCGSMLPFIGNAF
jgi:hypothetical protein